MCLLKLSIKWRKKAIYSLPAFISLPLLGTQHTGEGEVQGHSRSLPGTLGCVRRHRLFHYTWQLYELTSLWCISPAVCFSREGGTQIILNETNNISVAVSAIKQTVPQYAVGRLKTWCSLNRMKVVRVTSEKKTTTLCKFSCRRLRKNRSTAFHESNS